MTNERRLLGIFLFIWFLAGILQSIFTDLAGEEGYYVTFARHLDWGYFDHPPGVAFFTWLGTLILPGNLGARFMLVVLNTATLWICSRLIDPRLIPLYIMTVASLALIHGGNYFIKTDTPLVFFAALFFYAYREYVEGRENTAMVTLPIAITGMLLSKYHGILVVLLTVLSNPSLLKRKSFWWIAMLSAVLLLPHLYWEWTHDFATVRYHLGNRIDSGFKWRNVIDYIWMQPLVLGPLSGFILLPAALAKRAGNSFERALKYSLVGVLIFFLLSSFGVRIHKHWTSIALIPIVVMGIPYVADRYRLQHLLKILAVATLVFIIPARIYLAYDFLPRSIDGKFEIMHGWEKWAEDLDRLAAGSPVVFLNDYDSAGRFSYYTGETAHSYNAVNYQHTQHDLWPIEENIQGKPVLVIGRETNQIFQNRTMRNGALIHYRFVDDFQSFSKVEIRLAGEQPLTLPADTDTEVPITLINRYANPVTFNRHPELTPTITYHFFRGNEIVHHGVGDATLVGTRLEHGLQRTIMIHPPKDPGQYILRISIKPGWIPPSINSEKYKVTVAPRKQ